MPVAVPGRRRESDAGSTAPVHECSSSVDTEAIGDVGAAGQVGGEPHPALLHPTARKQRSHDAVRALLRDGEWSVKVHIFQALAQKLNLN